MEIYYALRNGSRERSRMIGDFIKENLLNIRELGIAGAHIDDNTVCWWLIPYLVDYLTQHTEKGINPWVPPTRANGESWGFVGYEITDLPEETKMGVNATGNESNVFLTYHYGDGSLFCQCGEPCYEDAMLMCDCIRKIAL